MRVRRTSLRRGGDAPVDDVPSWDEVARRHGDFVYTVAYRLTGDHHDAQDLVQEVLLRVQRGTVFSPEIVDAAMRHRQRIMSIYVETREVVQGDGRADAEVA